MNNCFKCGISDEKSMLYDAISDEGIIKVCRKCSFEENLPLIKKINEQEKRDRAIAEANSFELRKKLKQTPIRKTSVYNRLVSMSGITPVEKIDIIINEVERELKEKDATEIESKIIGNLAAKRLKKIDKVAYIRFSSVFRRFVDLDDFEEELKKINPSAGGK